MYIHATRGCADEEKYDYSVESKAKDFKTLLEETTREFRFGLRINRIPTNLDANDVPQLHRNLFTDYVDLTLNDILKLASIMWGNGIDTDGNVHRIIDKVENDPNIM